MTSYGSCCLLRVFGRSRHTQHHIFRYPFVPASALNLLKKRKSLCVYANSSPPTILRSLENAAEGMRNASNAVKAMQAQAQAQAQKGQPHQLQHQHQHQHQRPAHPYQHSYGHGATSYDHGTTSLADSVTSRLRAEALLATTQQIYDYQYQVRSMSASVDLPGGSKRCPPPRRRPDTHLHSHAHTH